MSCKRWKRIEEERLYMFHEENKSVQCSSSSSSFSELFVCRFLFVGRAFRRNRYGYKTICTLWVATYVKGVKHAGVEKRRWRENAGSQTALDLLQSLREQPTLHQTLDVGEIHSRYLHKKRKKEEINTYRKQKRNKNVFKPISKGV